MADNEKPPVEGELNGEGQGQEAGARDASPAGYERTEADLRADAERDFRKAKAKFHRRMDEMPLTITSLMDAMTILLVFLLISMTSDPLNVKQDDSLKLARSTVEFSPGDDSLPITVTKDHVLVDGEAKVKIDCEIGGKACETADFARLAHCDADPLPADCSREEVQALQKMRFKVDKSFKEDGNDENFLIVPLHKALQASVKRLKAENLELQREFKGIATIVADKDIPFRMIAEIVHTAGMAELGDIRFAVVKYDRR